MNKDVWHTYTADELALIERMWVQEGASAGQIAKALGWAVTRNAILGIAYRRGWAKSAADKSRAMARRVTTPRPKVQNNVERIRSIKRPELLAASDMLELFGPVNDFPPAGCCKYPYGDPSKGFQMCGWPTGPRDRADNQDGDSQKPYCDLHHTIAHQPKGAANSGTPHDPNAEYVKNPRAGNPLARRIGAFEMGTSHVFDLRDSVAA